MVVSAIGERLCERWAQPRPDTSSTYTPVPPKPTPAAAGRGQAVAVPPIWMFRVLFFNGGPPFRE